MTITQWLKVGESELIQGGVENARREAASLLAFVISRDRIFLIAHPEYELNDGEASEYDRVVNLRKQRVPFQHITGTQEFYGLDFEVSGDVLVPRPETELLVGAAIENLRTLLSPRFCEIGIGSGCITVSVLVELKTASAIACDISKRALKIARKNAVRHNVNDRLALIESDVFAGFQTEKFDAILSNPPYIPLIDISGLQTEVREYDPISALTDGRDGLSIIRNIIETAPGFLKSGSPLFIEIGHDQSENVHSMFSNRVWQEVTFLKDFQKFDRVVKAILA